MSIIKNLIISMVLIVISLSLISPVLGISLNIAATPTPFAYYGDNARYLFPSFSDDKCEQGQDFFLEIPVAGCTPAIVRSDLLEERDVPVFCRLVGTKLNPLIEVPHIKSIGLNLPGKNNSLIKHVLFHPARAGLKSTFTNLISSPQLNDLGYLVVILKKQESEKKMPDIVTAELATKIEYIIEKSFGVADNQLLIPVLDENEWKSSYKKYGFWKGKGYIRIENMDDNKAKIKMYKNERDVFDGFTLKKSDETNPKLMPGSQCSSGYILRLDDIEYPSVRAEIYVNGDKFVVKEGMELGDTGCSVKKIIVDELGLGGTVELSCSDGKYELVYGAIGEAKISIEAFKGEKSLEKRENKDYKIGDKIELDDINGKDPYLYLVNSLIIPGSGEKKKENLVIIAQIEKGKNKNKIVKKMREKIRDIISNEQLSGLSSKEIKEKIERELKKDEAWWKSITILGKGNMFVIVNEGNFKPIDSIFEKLLKWSWLDEDTKFNVKIIDIKGLENKMHSEITENYYKKAVDSYEEVSERYGAIYDKDGNSFGAKALYEAALKAEQLGKEWEQSSFLNKLIEEYPNSGIAEDAKKELNDLYSLINKEGAVKSIESEGKYDVVKLIDIIGLREEELNAELSIDNEIGRYGLGDEINGWIISEIDDKKVTFESSSNKISINEGKEKSLERKVTEEGKENTYTNKVKVIKINIKKMARISIKPWSNNGVTYSNFTFSIGIEKRAIQLNPEETKNMIAKLDEKIKLWEVRYDKLGGLVKTWKTSCLVGAGTLWLLNTLDNIGTGKTIARNKVMRGFAGNKGIMDECSDLVSKGDYTSQTLCLLDKEKKGEIKKKTEMWENAIKSTNKKIDEIKKDKGVWKDTPAGILGKKKVLDREAVSKKLGEDIFGKDKLIELSSNKDSTYLREEGLLFSEDEKELTAYLYLIEQCREKDADQELCGQVRKVRDEKQEFFNKIINDKENSESALSKVTNNLDIPISSIGAFKSGEAKTPKSIVFEITKEKFEKIGIKDIARSEKTSVLRDEDTGKIYLAVLGPLVGDKYDIKRLFEITEGVKKAEFKREATEEDKKNGLKEWPSSISSNLEGVSCGDRNYKGEKKVQFWESGSNKGLVAFMPLTNIKSGLYMATKSAYGYGTRAYDDSGKINNFWICSVGNDEERDFDFGLGPREDDSECCIQVNRNYELDTEVSWLGLDKLKIEKIRRCVDSVESKFIAGSRDVTSECCKDCNIGEPAVSTPKTACEDFMNPSECNLMFNLCDPVICPPSRCDFGGRYPVDNVIQTGIIGGLTLCAPNAVNENIAVPLCLTGIHAGLDNVITIMKSSRDCLNESLNTGKQVGICDEITSIYWCELLWREMTPLIKTGIPSLVEKGFLGGLFGIRKSGGEYLTFTDSWNKAVDSAKYITDYYGKEIFKIFSIRSLSQAGSFVCKQFISLKYPDSASVIDELTEPESPYQATAFMQEIPFTTATIPATSQYKVYYHIYAGRDSGHYYSVYLKQQGISRYYQTPEIMIVPESTGYLQAGKVIDKAVDFTAPEGYSEVCLRIDGKDECGFGKASTSFIVNYITDEYASKQAKQEVSTEEECISGTSGLIAPSLNPQELVSETINPAIYKRGIVRICSSKDPGEGTNKGRWDPVGFCDADRKIKCWIDKDSVKNAIKDLGIESKTLSEARKIADSLFDYKGYIRRDDAEKLFKEIENRKPIMMQELKDLFEKNKIEEDGKIEYKVTYTDIEKIIGKENDKKSIIGGLREIIDYGSIDSEDIRAKSQLQTGAVYNKVVELLMPKKVKKEEPKVEGKPKEKEIKKEAEVKTTTEDKCEIITSMENCLKEIDSKGIPKELIIGVSALESGWGKKPIGNNYFGIKKGSSWKGPTISTTTHEFNEKNEEEQVIAEFRDYDNLCESAEDFISVIMGSYPTDINSDAEKMAKNMVDNKGNKYATDPEWDTKVVSRIKEYNEARDSCYKKPKCVLKLADWNVKEAVEGDKVKLTVRGENCAGEEVQFIIKENDYLFKTFGKSESPETQPKHAIFETYKEDKGIEYSKAETEWISKWIDDGLLQGDPEYKFLAFIPRLSVKDKRIEKLSKNELKVKKSGLLGGLKAELKICETGIETEKTIDEIRISMLDNTMFGYNSYELKEECDLQLKEELSLITLEFGGSMIVEGYSSKEGSENYNLDLSQKRADKVRELIERILNEMNIQGIEITSIGKGETDKFSRQKYRKDAVDAEVKKIEDALGSEKEKLAKSSEILSLDRRVIIRIIQ